MQIATSQRKSETSNTPGRAASQDHHPHAPRRWPWGARHARRRSYAEKKARACLTAAGWAALAGRVTLTAVPTTRCASAAGSIASTRSRETCVPTGTIRTAAPSTRRRAARRGDADRVADRGDHLGHVGRGAPVAGGDEPRRGRHVRGPAHAPNRGPPGPTGEDAAADPVAAAGGVEASAATSAAMGVGKCAPCGRPGGEPPPPQRPLGGRGGDIPRCRAWSLAMARG